MSTPPLTAQALSETVGVYRTRDRIVRVRGDDARTWLNGQVSNDVRSLRADVATYALALTVKGRIVSDLWAVDDAPGVAIVLPDSTLTATLARFETHIIMEDVELVQDGELEIVTVQGPKAASVVSGLPGTVRVISCPRLGTVGFDCWLPQSAATELSAQLEQRASALGGGVFDEVSWEAAHVALGVPRVSIDFGGDNYPQEAGLKARALSFGKGCYLGQEVVYMLDNRGQLARRLVQLQAAAGSPLVSGALVNDGEGKRVGQVTSVAAAAEGSTLALAYVKREFSEPGQAVWVAGAPCQVRGVVGAT